MKTYSDNGQNTGASYGGSKYRLSYDKYQNGKVKSKIKGRSLVAAILIIAVFAVVGYFIVKYYINSMEAYDNSITDQTSETA